MILFQFQISNTESEDELDIIPNFCNWLCEQIYIGLNNKRNIKRLQIRKEYLLNVSWINWTHKKVLNVDDIMELIHNSLIYEQYRKGIWHIKINNDILIPNTSTSIDRLVRFLEYGDMNVKATGMFTEVRRHYNQDRLNSLWKLYTAQNLGYISDATIISN